MGIGSGLKAKRVVVVGGSSGIGLAVAQQAASNGAKMVLVSSNAERIQKAVESIGGEAQGHAVNVSNEGAVATFFAKLGCFDHLVFTTGDSLHLQDLAATDLQQAQHAFAAVVAHRAACSLACRSSPTRPLSDRGIQTLKPITAPMRASFAWI